MPLLPESLPSNSSEVKYFKVLETLASFAKAITSLDLFSFTSEITSGVGIILEGPQEASIKPNAISEILFIFLNFSKNKKIPSSIYKTGFLFINFMKILC